MRTILPEEIEKIEIPDIMDDDKHISVFFKNGEFEKYRATIRSNMYGIFPGLDLIEQRKNCPVQVN